MKLPYRIRTAFVFAIALLLGIGANALGAGNPVAANPAQTHGTASGSEATPQMQTPANGESANGQAQSAEPAPAEEKEKASAPTSDPSNPAQGLDKPDAEQTQGPEEKHLRQRVQARWDALIRNDFDALYEFTTPAYRKAFTKKHFQGGYATQIKRTGIEIKTVNFTNDEKTNATVTLNILYVTELWGGKLYNGSRHRKEAWVKIDGEWWIVEKR